MHGTEPLGHGWADDFENSTDRQLGLATALSIKTCAARINAGFRLVRDHM